MTFELEVLLGVCWFVVNFSGNLAILIKTKMRMSKNGSSLKLFSGEFYFRE